MERPTESSYQFNVTVFKVICFYFGNFLVKVAMVTEHSSTP